jgi:hypothetical protein
MSSIAIGRLNISKTFKDTSLSTTLVKFEKSCGTLKEEWKKVLHYCP